MNIDEYCRRYRKRKRDVTSAIKKGRMRGVERAAEDVDIPVGAKIEYYIPKLKSNITFEGAMVYIY